MKGLKLRAGQSSSHFFIQLRILSLLLKFKYVNRASLLQFVIGLIIPTATDQTQFINTCYLPDHLAFETGISDLLGWQSEQITLFLVICNHPFRFRNNFRVKTKPQDIIAIGNYPHRSQEKMRGKAEGKKIRAVIIVPRVDWHWRAYIMR